MNNLLAFAIEAHGGLNAWKTLQSLHANISIGGALWDQKGLPGLFKNTHVELKLPSQHVVAHLVDVDERIVFTPKQISLESEAGKILDTRNAPRSAFAGQSADSKWDKLHAGYFCSYALWGYLTTPFVYSYPGFEVQEIEPWRERGERWRGRWRLARQPFGARVGGRLSHRSSPKPSSRSTFRAHPSRSP